MTSVFRFFFLFISLLLFSLLPAQTKTAVAPAVKKNAKTIQGDKAFSKLDFEKAIGLYKQALESPTDTVYVVQRLGESYRLMSDRPNAEQWYAKIADNPKANSIVKLRYAELLRADQNYTEAKKYYAAYAAANPNMGSLREAIDKLGNAPTAPPGTGTYTITALGFNSPKSEFAPSFYQNGRILFTSNRSNEKAIYDKWTLSRYAGIYIANPDSAAAIEQLKLKVNGTKFESTDAVYLPGNLLIFSSGKFTKSGSVLKEGKYLPVTKLYSASFKDGKISDIAELPVNGDDFSNSHPSISKDGKTLYFASDKLGGQGGTDIYSSNLLSNGTWGPAQNLGPNVNSVFDEKFPFIADDGTLYFSSTSPDGYGGLDIYRSKFDNGRWSKPENLGPAINSPDDDFSFIIDAAKNTGYFASNRAGGKGEDDLYAFSFKPTPPDYKVTIKVIDENTSAPLSGVTLALDCKMPSNENSLTNSSGEVHFTIKGGNTCTVNAFRAGYKDGLAEISTANAGATIVIPIKADAIKVELTVKEEKTLLPIRNAVVAFWSSALSAPINYMTNDSGRLETRVSPGSYSITLPDYPKVSEQFSTSDANASTGIVSKQMFIKRDKMEVSVPLTASGFTTAVTVTDLKTGEENMVSPNIDGQLHLNLKLDRKYAVGYSGASDTITTNNLKPNAMVGKNWKFTVGQMWVVPNVYYDLNKWNIRKDAAKELDKLVKILKENPRLEIEMSSHTDCRSGSRYNVILSARRAKAAVDYLVQHGIKMKRIIAVGYGESKINNGCVCEPSDYSPCDAAQHQANRRTEVKVLKY